MSHRSLLIAFGLIIISVTRTIVAKQQAGLRRQRDIPKIKVANTRPPFDPNLQGGSQVKQFIKTSERSVRSVFDCENVTTSRIIEVTYGDDVDITCSCQEIGIVRWYDGRCEELQPSQRISFNSTNLCIKSFNKSDPSPYQCKLTAVSGSVICSDKTEIAGVESVPYGGAGYVILCIVLALLLAISICCIKRHKTGISLCFRDTCKSNNGRDGKIYDAYVSTGLSETDRPFVESFIRDCLKKRYRYNLIVDEKNILPRLDYSPKLQSNLQKCRRLIIIFSPSYMTHDWCMYCFNEGLRKIVDLHIPTIFIITDNSILSEMRSHADVVAHIPQVLLTQYQSSAERRQAIERIRQRMPPPMRFVSFRKEKGGLRAPMLSDAESIHKSETNLNGNGSTNYTENGREYRFGKPPEKLTEEIQMEYDQEHLESAGTDDFVTAVQTGEDIDPNKVEVHQYGARKDFYSLTMSDEGV